MMSAREAMTSLLEYDSKLKVASCKDYGKDWLFTAFTQENDVDPFYLVNKETGKIAHYTIAENPQKYYSSKNVSL